MEFTLRKHDIRIAAALAALFFAATTCAFEFAPRPAKPAGRGGQPLWLGAVELRVDTRSTGEGGEEKHVRLYASDGELLLEREEFQGNVVVFDDPTRLWLVEHDWNGAASAAVSYDMQGRERERVALEPSVTASGRSDDARYLWVLIESLGSSERKGHGGVKVEFYTPTGRAVASARVGDGPTQVDVEGHRYEVVGDEVKLVGKAKKSGN